MAFEKRTRVSVTAAVLLAIAGMLVACSRSTERPAPLSVPRSLLVVRGLDEPLIASAPTSWSEDQALSEAAAEFRRLSALSSEDERSQLGPFEHFVATHPHSGWAASVYANLGLSYYRSGYFSRALSALDNAWREGRTSTECRAQALIDRAAGELARMHARLGHLDALEALFKSIDTRPLTGPATELIQSAREGAWTMRNDPGVGFLCGPKALKNVLLTLKAPEQAIAVADAARSGEHGFTLDELDSLASKAGLPHRLIYRKSGEVIPVPSIINWKTHHYAAITAKDENGRYHIQDPTFGYGTELVVTEAAIDEESSGFFVVPTNLAASPSLHLAWRDATSNEARLIYGMGSPQQTVDNGTRPQDPKAGGKDPKPGEFPPAASIPANTGAPACGDTPMCAPSAHLVEVSLNLNDTPVGYAPQVGPAVFTRLTFNQRDAGQPATFTFFNISPKWTLNWLSYIQDNPTSAGASVMRYVSGGGYQTYTGYNTTSGNFTGEVDTGMVLTRVPATGALTSYTLSAVDGSALVFSKLDGATSGARRVFLTRVIDAQGHELQLDYDDSLRLKTVIDALGKVSKFCYDPVRLDCSGYAGTSLLVSQITDPFGRAANLDYDASGRLSSITDVYGIVSSIGYDANGIANSLTTPYGTSRFAYAFSECTGTTRCLELKDPLGNTQRVEYRDAAPGIAASDAIVPTGISYQNSYLNYRSTYYWDEYAYQKYGTGAAKDYTKAVHYHFMHAPNTSYTGWSLESTQRPLESRVWYNRGGTFSSVESTGAAGDAPTAAARLLDDGTTQLRAATYNANGRVTTLSDPLGRVTKFIYDTNNQDVLAVQQQTSAGSTPSYATLASFTYNEQHQPISYKDAAGNTTRYGYNADGQLQGIIDPLQNQTSYAYDASGRVRSVTDTNGNTLLTLTYDDFDRVSMRAEPNTGYFVSYEYDAIDRLTKASYPDGSAEIMEYTNLDLTKVTDRLGKQTSYEYDAARRLTSVTDAAGHKTSYTYYANGALRTLTDAKGNVTSWDIDVQSRPIVKHYEGGAAEAIGYETSTSRVKQEANGRGLVTAYAYNKDDSLASISYPNAPSPTSAISFQYDSVFPRRLGMTDGFGQTDYTYYPFAVTPTLGAGLLKSIESPVAGSSVATDAVRFSYDALNRIATRTVNGAVEQVKYDSTGRLTSVANPLDTFAYGYSDATPRVAAITPSVGPVSVFAYNDAKSGGLLESITVTANGTSLSKFGYKYDANQKIAAFTQSYVGQKLPQRANTKPISPETGGAGRLPPASVRETGSIWVSWLAALFALGTTLLLVLSENGPRRRYLLPFTLSLLLFASCGGDGTTHGNAPGGTGPGGSGESGDAGAPPDSANGGADSELAGSPNGGGAIAGGGGKSNTAGNGTLDGESGAMQSDAGADGSAAGPSVQVTEYRYDDANRLASATVGTDLGLPQSPQYTYAYDAASNLTEIGANGQSKALAYTPTNAIAGNPYDLDGNPQSLNGKQYKWDVANRVISVVDGAKQSNFSYDGLSRLVRIQDFKDGKPVSDRAFLWCGTERCAERDNTRSGSPVVKQFFAQGVKIGADSFYYTADALGSVRQLVDGRGNVRAQYEYDPYGNRTTVRGDLESDIGYAGYFHHAESSLDLALYRAYDPTVGRWLNRDPINEAGGVNLYGYANGNPTSLVDPTGTVAAAAPLLAFCLTPEGWVVCGGALVIGEVWLITHPPTIHVPDPLYNRPPSDAKDPEGAKAPGKPGETEGFKDPKGGEKWVPNPNPGKGGSANGWLDDKGRVWCPTGQGGRAHGGPHWDVQLPNGGNKNVPRGKNINDIP